MYSQSEDIAWSSLSGEETPTYEDYTKNGLYCRSGLAFPKTETPHLGRCTEVDYVEFDDKRIEFPYKCDPRDNEKKCKLWYATTVPVGNAEPERDFYETECRCALDGDNGYCGTILGTPHYEEEISKVSNLLQSSQCHTNDRENFLAMRDKCSITKTDEWDKAIQARYELNYWPYVQTESSVSSCLEDMFMDSPTNMKKFALEAGTVLTASAAVLLTTLSLA
jgi:hypothetical protein